MFFWKNTTRSCIFIVMQSAQSERRWISKVANSRGLDELIQQQLVELGVPLKEEQDEQDIQQLRYILMQILNYPSTTLANNHKQANRIGLYDLPKDTKQQKKKTASDSQLRSDNNNQRNVNSQERPNSAQINPLQGAQWSHCEDCGFVIQRDTLSICEHSIGNISNLGVSAYLFFESYFKAIILMLQILLVFSIFAFTTNLIDSQSRPQIPHSSGKTYYPISYAAKMDNRSQNVDDHITIQAWLGFALIPLWAVTFLLLKYKQAKGEINQEIRCQSAADYTLMLEGIPKTIDRQGLQTCINKELSQKGQMFSFNDVAVIKQARVAKLNMVKPFYQFQSHFSTADYKRVKEQLQQNRQKVVDLLQERKREGKWTTPSQQRNNIYKTFANSKKQLIVQQEKIIEQIRKQFDQDQDDGIDVNLTTVFVTFHDNHNKNMIYLSFYPSLKETLLSIITLGWYQPQNLKITYNEKKYGIRLSLAPQPQDIVWTNMGYTRCDVLKRKLVTYLVTFIIIGISFAIQYVLLNVQRTAQFGGVKYAISAVVVILNLVLQFVIALLTAQQKDITVTNYQTSLFIKTVTAQFLNTIIIPIVVNTDNIYGLNGLADNIFTYGIINAIAFPLILIVGPGYRARRLIAYCNSSPEKKLKLKQSEYNRMNQLPQMEIGYESVYISITFHFTCFFAPLQPCVALFSIIGIIGDFWVHKYLLFKRAKRPVPGTSLVNSVITQVFALGGVSFAVGSIIAIQVSTGQGLAAARTAIYLTLAAGIVVFLIPFDYFFKTYIADSEFKQPLSVFEEQRYLLPSQYDRLNPATSDQAIKQYMRYLLILKRVSPIVNRALYPTNKDIEKSIISSKKRWKKGYGPQQQFQFAQDQGQNIADLFFTQVENINLGAQLKSKLVRPARRTAFEDIVLRSDRYGLPKIPIDRFGKFEDRFIGSSGQESDMLDFLQLNMQKRGL